MPFAIWAVVFLRVPLPQAMSANSGKKYRFCSYLSPAPAQTDPLRHGLAQQSPGILDIVIARVAVIGVSMIAVLSGSGAVNAAWDTYEAFTQPSMFVPFLLSRPN